MAQCSLLEAGLYLLPRSLVGLDPFERRLALEKLLGQETMEWSVDRQRRQTCGKGQECEVHPDDPGEFLKVLLQRTVKTHS